jgi:hypothetical protein
MLALQLLHLAYHPQEVRWALLINAGIFYALVVVVLLLTPTALTVMLGLSAAFALYAVADAMKRVSRAPERA